MAQVTPGMKFQATRSDVKTESSLGTAKQNTRSKYWAIEDIQDLSNVAATVSSLTCTGKLILDTEEITNGDTLSSKAVSYLTIAGANETSTLAAGQEGQVKIIAVNTIASGGGHTVNVAGGGLATLVFDNADDACTIICVNGKWRFAGKHNLLSYTT